MIEDLNFIETEDNIEEPLTVQQALGAAIVKAKIKRTAAGIILKVLHFFYPEIPADYRTLLRTPRKGDILEHEYEGGKFIDYALERELIPIAEEIEMDKMTILTHIDGVPVANSSRKQFWAITCLVKEIDYPFLSGIFMGETKPKNSNEFMGRHVKKLEKISREGITTSSKRVDVSIGPFIGDAPARSFALNVKQHNGINCCTKCKARAEYKVFPSRKSRSSKQRRLMSFTTERAPPRTDHEFRMKSFYCSDKRETFHKSEDHMVLEDLDIDMVKMWPFDYMHCTLLGNVRHMISVWTDIFPNFLAQLDEALDCCRDLTPREFQRKCRGPKDSWKATECRLFLLYLSPVVLRDILPEKHFNHFMKLVCGMRILCSRRLMEDHIDLAEQLIHSYTEEFPELYPFEPLRYNIHCTDHLAECCREQNGTVDDFSAFFGENFLQKIKSYYTRGNLPLTQVAYRLEEEINILGSSLRSSYRNKETGVSKKIKGTNDYKRLHINNYTITSTLPNNIIMTDTTVMIVDRIYENDSDEIRLEGRAFLKDVCGDAFTSPINATLVSMYTIENRMIGVLGSLVDISVDRVVGKCMAIASAIDDVNVTTFVQMLHW